MSSRPLDKKNERLMFKHRKGAHALFGWISRPSLACVYGLDGDSVEEMLIANGREYPESKVLKDGHSSEIRKTLDTCVCNAVPVLISNLRLQIPLSKLELTLVCVRCIKQLVSYLICTIPDDNL
jgi:hypothetical protein